ncbi:MAG: flagellar motor protein MotA, partial [Thermoanaerobaculia bacterium]|nr:flagellar motor protein MotA [Thermoanaerobaculia bacterium]
MPLSSLFLTAQIGAESEPGIVDLFLRAGPMAKFVLGLLAVMSIASWSIMIGKQLQLRRANRQSEEFLEVFRRSERFSEVSQAAESLDASPLVG